jgi:uncharacterized protein (DUF849 family)
VGVSSGAWIVPDVSLRLSFIRSWDVLPDFASVKIHEEGALRVIQLLLDKGVGVEARIWTAQAAETLLTSGLDNECLRILIEPAGQSGDGGANLLRIEGPRGRQTPPSPARLGSVGLGVCQASCRACL